MRKLSSLTLIFGSILTVAAQASNPTFALVKSSSAVIKDASGKSLSIPLVDDSAKRKLTVPVAKVDPKVNVTLVRAATIAQDRAYAHSKSRCWHFVKEALVAAGAVSSRPKTEFAKQAGDELVRSYGFRKLAINDPYAAPIGAVLVYGGKGAGHVEIRDQGGFVSDFRTPTPSKRKLIGVYAKV